MFDACINYDIKGDEKKRFHLVTGKSVVTDALKFSGKDVVFLSPKDEKALAEAVKRGLFSGVINAELLVRKDSLTTIKSGIDDSVAKMMGEKKIAIVFNMGLLIRDGGKDRARMLRRMKENMRRAVKYDVPVLFASCAKDKYGLFNGSQIEALAYYLGIDNFIRVKTSFNKLFK